MNPRAIIVNIAFRTQDMALVEDFIACDAEFQGNIKLHGVNIRNLFHIRVYESVI